MLYTIYSVFVDSATFIWKYPYVTITSYLYLLTSWLLGKIAIWKTLSENFIGDLFSILTVIFDVIFITTIIYFKEVLSDKNISFWKLLKNSTERVFILSLQFLLVLLLGSFLMLLISLVLNENLLEFVFTVVLWNIAIAYFFGIMHQIFYQTNLMFVPMQEGLKGFYKNFVFYFLILLISFFIFRFPSLLIPASWLTMPLVPLVESVSINQFGWTSLPWLLISPILSTLQIVAINFAFLYKNRNKLPKIGNPKSEIVN